MKRGGTWILAAAALVGSCTPEEDRPECPAASESWAPVIAPWTIASELDGFRFAEGTVATSDGLGFEASGEMALDVIATRGVAYRVRATATAGAGASLFIDWVADNGATERLAQADLAAPVDVTVTPSLPGRQLALRLVGTDGVHVDALTVDYDEWDEVSDAGEGTLRLGFVVHVEDVPEVKSDEAAWLREARVFEGLIRTFAAHGASVTVQPDATFAVGAGIWDPDWLGRMEALGAGWSAHLHDEDEGAEELEQAARAARKSWKDLSLDVRDVNGGFQLAIWSRFADAGFESLSAFKDPLTQSGLPLAGVLPWRPADGAGTDDVDRFLTHDPDGPLVYLAGATEREASHQRFPEVATRRISQMLAHTREGEINTAYILSHVDLFGPAAADDAAIDAYLDGAEFQADLAYYDGWLTETIDPMVEAGRIEWQLTGEMAADWLERERDCAP